MKVHLTPKVRAALIEASPLVRYVLLKDPDGHVLGALHMDPDARLFDFPGCTVPAFTCGRLKWVSFVGTDYQEVARWPWPEYSPPW